MDINEDQVYRINDLIPPKKSDRPRLLPMSRSSWWQGVKDGKYPQPIKYGPRITAWRGSDIKRFLTNGLEG